MTEEQTFEYFDNYLNGALSPEEAKEFETTLDQNDQLKQQFETYKEGIELIKLEGFRREVGELISAKSTPRSLGNRNWYYSMAASIAIVVVGSFFLIDFSSAPGELFDDYYQPYPNIYQTRSGSANISEAFNAYSAGDFQSAIQIFNSLESPTEGAIFYQALCYLSLKEPDSALSKLSGLSDESIFAEQATWYSGLSFLLKEEIDSAQTYFNRIAPDNYNYREAQLLINELD